VESNAIVWATLTLTKVTPWGETTAIGVGLFVVLPFPSSPSWLSPQQNAVRAKLTAQLDNIPALTIVNVSMPTPVIAAGVVLQGA